MTLRTLVSSTLGIREQLPAQFTYQAVNLMIQGDAVPFSFDSIIVHS